MSALKKHLWSIGLTASMAVAVILFAFFMGADEGGSKVLNLVFSALLGIVCSLLASCIFSVGETVRKDIITRKSIYHNVIKIIDNYTNCEHIEKNNIITYDYYANICVIASQLCFNDFGLISETLADLVRFGTTEDLIKKLQKQIEMFKI